jgi:hypothetical protein
LPSLHPLEDKIASYKLGCSLIVDDCVVDLHTFSARSLCGLGSRLAVAGKNGSSCGRDFAILLVDDLDCIVINFPQRGCIPVRIVFDRIVLSVKLAAPLVVSGLAFCVDSIVRKSEPPFYRVDLGPLGGGPGSYFDFARFSFQFPLNTSAANDSVTAKYKTMVAKTNILRFIGDPPLSNQSSELRRATIIRWSLTD